MEAVAPVHSLSEAVGEGNSTLESFIAGRLDCASKIEEMSSPLLGTPEEFEETRTKLEYK